ncbi:hypothetical protein PSTG_16427 [Puccinia striiformis f. sp. tritici PST-78]|uniref:Uncharacterized protein n=1 Tax=Puccinia striiformis f. sp. tritici PST-78 TaxID=1165861 RepID=A0A0L0USS3_9BASI|nr:hypothetical protein PSTG_16427 [Puccinia striiformis f. sp. tritici PST-78]
MARFIIDRDFPLLQGPDVLCFTGKFVHELGPIPEWGIAPVNDQPSNLSVVKTSGTLTPGIKYSFISLSTYDGTPPRLHALNTYDIAGQIIGFDSQGHPNFSFPAGDQRTTKFGFLLKDRPHIIISGVGTITHVSHQSNQNDDDPIIIELDVKHHGNPASREFSITQCILNPHSIELPNNVEIVEGSHIYFKGAYDGVLRPSRKLIIKPFTVIVDEAGITADLTDTSDDGSSTN